MVSKRDRVHVCMVSNGTHRYLSGNLKGWWWICLSISRRAGITGCATVNSYAATTRRSHLHAALAVAPERLSSKHMGHAWWQTHTPSAETRNQLQVMSAADQFYCLAF